MALVNPNIAMSFRQPEFRPRNAMAEYAQMQQIEGGQRQAEIADMQLEELRRDRDALSQIQAAIVAKGGPPDLGAAADAMLKNPKYFEQGLRIKETLKKQELLNRYESQYGGGAAMPASALGAMAAPAAPSMRPETIADRDGKPVEIEVNRGIAPPGAMGQPLAPFGAAAPAPAAPTAPINAIAPVSAMPDVNALRRQYSMAVAAGSPDAPVILKQVEAALRGEQNRPMADRFVPVGRLVFDRETQQYISPSQAQLAQSQERPATAAPGGKAPAGYRFTPTGDLEPIPGGPAARAAEVKPLTPAQEIKRRDTLGKEFKLAQGALQTTQDVLDSIAFVRSEPGLSRATGFSGTMLPSFPEGKAASAETRLANLKGKVTALGKAAAAATGAIGSIATVEWKILSDQIAAIDPVKGTGPLLDQIDLVETQAKGALERIRDGYQRQFGEDFERFPQFSDLPPPKSSFKPRASTGGAKPAAPAAPNIDALLKKYN